MKKQIIFNQIEDFNLEHIFDCGQAFRWSAQKDGSYHGIVGSRVANISFLSDSHKISEGKIRIDSLSKDLFSIEEEKDFWWNYLDLGRDYGKIKNEFVKKDPLMLAPVKEGAGIRILNQDPWETLISFIISQNNNIPRIQKCIESLSMKFGEKIESDTIEYSFPHWDRLAELNIEEINTCKLGYRGEYIIQTAKTIAKDQGQSLYNLRDADAKEAEEYLLTLKGVGPKVAHCIMLFSLGKYGMFPIDVWMRRVMNRLYNIDENNIKEMQLHGEKNFGTYAGVAQQYLFYYIKKMG